VLSIKSIREVAPEIADKFESEDIKTSQKDIRTLGKILNQGTIEQKEQIVSELKNDPRKAIDIAREFVASSKTESYSPIPDAFYDKHVGDTITTPKAIPSEYQSDIDIFLKLAERICCPKCGELARNALKWSCCGLSIDEAADLADDGRNEPSAPIESKANLVGAAVCEHRECAETPIEDHYHEEPKCYSKMSFWIPPDNSSMLASKILRAFVSILNRDEAPSLDTLTEITGLPAEDIEAYLGKAPWVQKEEASDGLAIYLPRKPPQAT
jgi:hypothetical protein